MNSKAKAISYSFGIITCIFLIFVCLKTKEEKIPKTVYQVYLDGAKVGLVNNQEELYQLINEEQNDIKEKYSVETVYPPNGFEIQEYITYDDKISSADSIYSQIKEKGDFTVKGYTITINKPIEALEEGQEDKIEKSYIYVLDDNVFKEALEKVVKAFINETDYNNYINNTQSEIEDVGSYIDHMYFEEDTTIKETNISINEKIYLNSSELSQYLLFGTNQETLTYTVQRGDTIESISETNKLNVNEFLIANPKFKSKDNLLAIDEKVAISLINPVLTLVQELTNTSDIEEVLEKTTIVDSTKGANYSEVTQTGVTGMNRVTQAIKIINGVRNQNAIIINKIIIRDAVEEITTVGQKKSSSGIISGSYVDTGLDWKWPTNSGYIITTGYEYRWGTMHYALDISGTGFNSPIYAAREGEIVETSYTCGNYGYIGNTCGGSYGNYVVIKHENNYYTLYAHLTKEAIVTIGKYVNAGEQIGKMGSSGSSSGPHLHFGTSIGHPIAGNNTWFNPWSLYR